MTVPLSLSFKCNCKCINFKIMNYLKLGVWQRNYNNEREPVEEKSYWYYPGDGRIKKTSGEFEVRECKVDGINKRVEG